MNKMNESRKAWKTATWIAAIAVGIGFIYYGISGRLCLDNLPWLYC